MTNMTKTKIGCLIMLALAITAGPDRLAAQSGYDLFQKALAAERADGNLRQAIQLYSRVVNEFAGDRALAARALVRMGDCYERLGDAESQTVYERVARDFVDQNESATIARARLAVLRERRAQAPTIGMASRQVWTGPGVDALGSIAADGRLLSFVDWETGDLAVRTLATGQNRRLTNKGSWEQSSAFALFSRLSPDGRLVAYNWFRNQGWEVRVGPVDGSSHRVLLATDTNEEYAQPDAWSPDGKQVAVLLLREINQIALISIADGSMRILKSLDWRSPGTMAFSPDGKYIAYDFQTAERSPERDIYIIAVDGTRETRVVDHPADDYLLGWMADGRILFASDRGGPMGAWTLSVANGHVDGPPELLKRDLGDVSPIGLTRAGSLYYGLKASGSDVYVVPLNPATGMIAGEPVRVPHRFIGTNFDPDWSADGRHLAYVSARSMPVGRIGAQILCIADVESGEQRELPVRLGYVSRPRWSPDGGSILFRANDERGRVSFFIADAESGRTVLLARRDGLQLADWARDGKHVFITTTDYGDRLTRKQMSWIVARDVNTGEERELFRETANAPAGDAHLNNLSVSPDGRQLAFTVIRGKTKVVIVLPAEGGEPREIFHSSTDFQMPNFAGLSWTPDGQKILLAKESGRDQQELWALDARGGRPRPVGLRTNRLRDAAIHPGGRQIVFQSGTQSWDIWALENLQRRPR